MKQLKIYIYHYFFNILFFVSNSYRSGLVRLSGMVVVSKLATAANASVVMVSGRTVAVVVMSSQFLPVWPWRSLPALQGMVKFQCLAMNCSAC